MSEIILGIKYGLTLFGFFNSFICWFSKDFIPPIPEPSITPTLLGSKLSNIPESSNASLAAINAKQVNLSILFNSF
jgi:hypothetical protein